MPLKTAEPPENCLQLLSDAVQGSRWAQPTSGPGVWGAEAVPHDLHAAAPHLVYTLALPDIPRGDLSRARTVSWRFLMLRESEPVVTGEVAVEGPGGGLAFSELNEGPFVAGSARTIALAERLPEVVDNDYELRVLRIPALYVMALWLHSQERDILIPMAPTHHALEADHPYDPKAFFEALAPAAAEREQFDDTPEASSAAE